ncbi:ABC transporter ATP-binding protein [Clostridia bacterium]|nr:ABC transporter ATP-binding protein [Clostridia bacterium]
MSEDRNADVRRGEELLALKNVKTYYVAKRSLFPSKTEYVKAVDGVSFSIRKGETVGLVGESGCGKSTVGRTILRLEDACAGEILYRNRDLCKLSEKEMRALRSKIQIVFQDPYSSLNPKMTVGALIMEPMLVHHLYSPKERLKRVEALLEMVGLRGYHAKRYPHEFSGGQRQRIDIARSLAANPEMIICDEAVSALDVSIQAQVLNLLTRLQRELDLTYLFISHGLAAVRHISNRIGVMYLGKIVEIADSDELLSEPVHPYTQALISAIPVPDPDVATKRIILQGDVPSPINPPSGCRFHTRCIYATERCRQDEPVMREIGTEHYVACHLASA